MSWATGWDLAILTHNLPAQEVKNKKEKGEYKGGTGAKHGSVGRSKEEKNKLKKKSMGGRGTRKILIWGLNNINNW